MTNQKISILIPPYWKNEKILVLFISIFYLVGAIGLSIPTTKDLFLDLSPYHLLLNLIVLILARKNTSNTFLLFSFLVFFLGMLIEIIGVHSGILFGEYAYGSVLGIKFMGVPLIIGVNWLVLVICCSTWMMELKTSVWVKTALSAALMTALDILIEPIAVRFEYWTWQGGEIPVYNYICWFALSLPMHYGMLKWNLLEKSIVPKAIATLLFGFFIYLNLI